MKNNIKKRADKHEKKGKSTWWVESNRAWAWREVVQDRSAVQTVRLKWFETHRRRRSESQGTGDWGKYGGMLDIIHYLRDEDTKWLRTYVDMNEETRFMGGCQSW